MKISPLYTVSNSLATGKILFVTVWDHEQSSLINISDTGFEISSDVKDFLNGQNLLKSIRHKYGNNTSPDLHRVVLH